MIITHGGSNLQIKRQTDFKLHKTNKYKVNKHSTKKILNVIIFLQSGRVTATKTHYFGRQNCYKNILLRRLCQQYMIVKLGFEQITPKVNVKHSKVILNGTNQISSCNHLVLHIDWCLFLVITFNTTNLPHVVCFDIHCVSRTPPEPSYHSKVALYVVDINEMYWHICCRVAGNWW